MNIFFIVFSTLLFLISLLPFIHKQHWFFRVPEFLNLQILFLQGIAIIGLLIFTERNEVFWVILILQIALIIYQLYIFFHFTKLNKSHIKVSDDLSTLKIISTNIYQFNKDFDRFKSFISKENPDLFLTIESNKDWEKAMRDLEHNYPHSKKITLENTYGMHLYSKLPFSKIETHYFVADDVPSIEAHIQTKDNHEIVVFCVHPPPPSPTEETNSKERDGDLMCIAKRVKEIEKPVLVIGDFNTVAWSRISELFRKKSELIDGRHGRGILASFHAKYWFFRTPLDLVYHCEKIALKELKIMPDIGSDHFPVSCEFGVSSDNETQKNEIEQTDQEEDEKSEELIKEGKTEESENRGNSTFSD